VVAIKHPDLKDIDLLALNLSGSHFQTVDLEGAAFNYD
jgi:hypothetical protein